MATTVILSDVGSDALPNTSALRVNVEINGVSKLLGVSRLAAVATPSTRQIVSGNGLSGGGDLSADRTLAVVPGDTSVISDAGGVRVGSALPNPITLTSAVMMSGVISPASLSSNQTDYVITNFGVIVTVRQDCSAAVTINSLVGGVAGKGIFLHNISANTANTITLLHDDGATGVPGNRFLCAANTSAVIHANGTAHIRYDGISFRWRVVSVS